MINAKISTIPFDEMRSDLEALIRFDTCFPPAARYGAFCDLVESLAADLDVACERITVPEHLWKSAGVSGARVNMLLRPNLGPSTAPEALIYFHADTAPIGDGWTRPALELTQEGDKLFGRGTADMKGCIAAVLAVLRSLKASNTPLAFRPVLAICTDEEGGLHPGIRYLAETQELPEVLLNLNGGAMPRIWGGCLGSMDVTITGTGVAVHSGRPHLGVNALEAMIPVMTAITDLKTQVETRETDMPPAPGDPKLCARLNVTACHAGDKGSALPGHCQIVLNRRYLPEEDPDTVFLEMKDCVATVLSQTPLRSWDVTQTGHLPPVCDPTGPWTLRWASARAAAEGRPLSDFTKYGSGTSSDFGWVQKAGIQHMLLGGLMRPTANVHGPDEHTTTHDMELLARSVALFLSADFTTDPDQQGTSSYDMETST